MRIGNGFAGSPGSLVHIGTDGATLSESPAATDPSSRWRQVFDITTATKAIHPETTEGGGCGGGGAIEVSLDDRYLHHVVIGRGPVPRTTTTRAAPRWCSPSTSRCCSPRAANPTA